MSNGLVGWYFVKVDKDGWGLAEDEELAESGRETAHVKADLHNRDIIPSPVFIPVLISFAGLYELPFNQNSYAYNHVDFNLFKQNVWTIFYEENHKKDWICGK